jgi:hypothetical protein
MPEGYASLIGPLASGLNIVTSKVVNRIKYDGDGVEVITKEGEVRSVSLMMMLLFFLAVVAVAVVVVAVVVVIVLVLVVVVAVVVVLLMLMLMLMLLFLRFSVLLLDLTE